MITNRIFLITIISIYTLSINSIRAQECELEWEWKNIIESNYDPILKDFYHTAFDSEGNWFHFGVCKEFISINGEEVPTNYELNAYIKKYNSYGHCIDYFILNYIPTTFPSLKISPQDIYLDSEDNIILSFSYAGTVLYNSDTIADLSLNDYAYFISAILKLDKNGNYLNIINLEKSFYVINNSIDIDHENNIYSTGFYIDTLIVQNDTVISSNRREVYLLKIGSNGEKHWLKSFNGIGPGDEGYSVMIGHDNNCYLLANFQYGCNIENITIEAGVNIVKFNSSGEFIKSLNISEILIPQKGYNGLEKCLSFNNSNNILVHKPYDISYLFKISYNFENVELDLSDTLNRNFLHYIHMDQSDNLIISGSFRDTLLIGDTVIYRPGTNHYILAYNEIEKLNWINYTDRYYFPNSYNNSVYLTNAVDSILVFGKIKQSANHMEILTKKGAVKIFPNPSSELIQIELQELNEIVKKIVLYDINGSQKQIIKESIRNNKIIMSVEKLEIGIYTIEIITDKNRYYKNIIKA